MSDADVPSVATKTAFPVEVNGEELWVSLTRRGPLPGLCYTKVAAEAEAKADDSRTDNEQALKNLVKEIAEHTVWRCIDNDGASCLIVKTPENEILKQSFANSTISISVIEELIEKLNKAIPSTGFPH